MGLYEKLNNLNWHKGLFRIFIVYSVLWFIVGILVGYLNGNFRNLVNVYTWDYSQDYLISEIEYAVDVYQQEISSNSSIANNGLCNIFGYYSPSDGLYDMFKLADTPVVLINCDKVEVFVDASDFNISEPFAFVENANLIFNLLSNQRNKRLRNELRNLTLLTLGGAISFISFLLLFCVLHRLFFMLRSLFNWIALGFKKE